MLEFHLLFVGLIFLLDYTGIVTVTINNKTLTEHASDFFSALRR
jgi:hypothetical protein